MLRNHAWHLTLPLPTSRYLGLASSGMLAIVLTTQRNSGSHTRPMNSRERVAPRLMNALAQQRRRHSLQPPENVDLAAVSVEVTE